MNSTSIVRSAALLALTIMTACSIPLRAQGTRFVGVWKLNVSKSKAKAGAIPNSAQLMFFAANGEFESTFESVGTDGVTRRCEMPGHFDGKDHPITGDCAFGDTASRKLIDAKIFIMVFKKDGKVTVIERHFLNEDGTTMTIKQKGVLLNGQKVDQILIYERQPYQLD